jgi:hypothetical protein
MVTTATICLPNGSAFFFPKCLTKQKKTSPAKFAGAPVCPAGFAPKEPPRPPFGWLWEIGLGPRAALLRCGCDEVCPRGWVAVPTGTGGGWHSGTLAQGGSSVAASQRKSVSCGESRAVPRSGKWHRGTRGPLRKAGPASATGAGHAPRDRKGWAVAAFGTAEPFRSKARPACSGR